MLNNVWIGTTVAIIFLATKLALAAGDDETLLPRVQVQFICGHDVRPGFNATSTVEDFYKRWLPDDVSISRLHSSLKISGMKDIPSTKWYYSSCNISSPQVLTTLTITAAAYVQSSSSSSSPIEERQNNQTNSSNDYYDSHPVEELEDDDLRKDLTPGVFEKYFTDYVCKDMVFFHAVVEDDWRNNLPKHNNDQNQVLDHSLFLLCGGADVIYYDQDGAPDSGFVLFGFLVGIAMIGMIFSELQKFESHRPSPQRSSTRRSRRDNYAPTFTQEVEMV